MAQKPPLGLSVNLTDPAGNGATWHSDAARPGDRPQGINFRTIRGNGFGDASCTLIRDGRLDSFDLGLFNDATFVGDDGTVAYEGRLNAFPRSFDQTGSSITPTFAGHMSIAQDRPFSEIYVDRLLSNWGPASVQERANRASAWSIQDPAVQPDIATGFPSLAQEIINQPWGTGGKPRHEAFYDAGSKVLIGSIYYAWKKNGNINPADTNWGWNVQTSTDDLQTSTDDTGTLRAAGPGTGTLTATGNNKRYGIVQLYYNAANAGTGGETYGLYWTCLAAIGTHGLTQVGSGTATTAPGLNLSDILVNVAQRFCPGLNTDGVQFNGTLIEQCRYDESLPYDAFLDLNKYALWELAVWEGKTLHYAPADLTDYDWEVRLSDPGVTTSLQGDDASNLYNGVRVTFTDAADGKTKILSPDDYPDLRDDAVENPANEHGLTRWFPWALSSPCTIGMALNTGRAKLAELNQPKEAGTVSLTGHVRDRAGHWRPVHEMRAGQTLAITDFPNARSRLIVETDYSHDGYTINVGVDNTLSTIEGFLDRYGTALSAAGIA